MKKVPIKNDTGRGAVRGLHIKTASTGRQSYYLLYSVLGQRRRPKIGEVDNLPLSKAREISKDWLAMAQLGKDPSLERKLKRGEMNMSALFDVALRVHWDNERLNKPISEKHRLEVRRTFEKDIKPRFGNVKITDLKARDIRVWHGKYKDKIYAGNRALEVISRMFNVAQAEEIVAQGINPAMLVKPFSEKPRKRPATMEELDRVLLAIALRYPLDAHAGALLYALIYTGARPSALLRAKWTDLTVERDGQRLKNILVSSGKSKRIYIPTQIMKLIKTLPRVASGKIFDREDLPYTLWNEIRKEAGCPDLRMRDLRSTYATIAKSKGIPVGVTAELMGHADTATTDRHYAGVFSEVQADGGDMVAAFLDQRMASSVEDVFS